MTPFQDIYALSTCMDLSYILNELGEDRDAYYNAMAPPIMQTSNFKVATVDELKNLFKEESSGYLYSRGMNPTVTILRKKLAALDEAEDALVFNSGAAAIFAGVLANVKAGDHVISVKNPYSWVQRIFDNILSRFGVETTYIDGTRIAHFEAARRPETRFIYLESPNSWTYELQDIAAVAAFARANGIVTLMDNSHCSPLYQKPIVLGVDLSMQTATKYIGGHSDTLGGVLSGSSAMIKKIFDSEYMAIGSGIQPFNAWLLIRGLRTLDARIARITETTYAVLDFLKNHPAVEKTIFPFDPGFPQFELAKKQMTNACGLISFYVHAKSRRQIVRFCESLRHIMMAVSWGGHESLILPRCASLEDRPETDGGDSVKTEKMQGPVDNWFFDPKNPEHRLLRLYVGLESADYLIADLRQALDTSF